MLRPSAFLFILFSVLCSFAAANEPVNVLSINIRCSTANDGDNGWVHRRDFMLEVVRQRNYDFIGAQDVVMNDQEELNQLKYMNEKLPEYNVISHSRGKNNQDETVPIWYRKDRWEIDAEQQGVFWLSDTPDIPGSVTWKGQSQCPRIVIWGLFHEKDKTGKKTGKALYFYSTHFDHVGKEACIKAAVMLAETIANRKNKEYPAIAVGDLNSGENSPPIKYLRGETITLNEKEIHAPILLADTFAALYPDKKGLPTYHGYDKTKAEKETDLGRIDYIFTTEGLKAGSADILRTTNSEGRYPTDHFPVSAVLEWK